ncbi:LOW QUALITY PROTEIN: hypothetical protein MKX08_006896 [Trichoderma sp. CBMAI-0020]|nr:LOW QUALITY PROTEIN: hypothetical protein MKX08_006896 [Trichoderma sp. CBMAI-0020]
MLLGLGQRPGRSIVWTSRIHGINMASWANSFGQDRGSCALSASDFEDAAAWRDAPSIDELDAMLCLGNLYSEMHFDIWAAEMFAILAAAVAGMGSKDAEEDIVG